MSVIRYFLRYTLVLAILLGGGVFLYKYYSWLFSKSVQGRIVGIARITTPTAILGRSSGGQLHSYAITIRDKDGNLHISSSEDMQWQVAQKGLCADALFYRYPPWELQYANTFFNARLRRLYDCPPGMPGEGPSPQEDLGPDPSDVKGPKPPKEGEESSFL